MLNKKLLLATTGHVVVGHTKLTVGEYSSSPHTVGYHTQFGIGALSRIPLWDLDGKSYSPLAIAASIDDDWSYVTFPNALRVVGNSITMTIVEKGLTVTLPFNLLTYMLLSVKIFDLTDVGKTYTIIFDPEPTGYA